MVSKVFILGRTGSGKSTASRLLAKAAQESGWSAEAFNDYSFLREMFISSSEDRFRSTDYDGFEVLDLSIYDEAISNLLQKVQNYRPETDRTLLTIEFTSNNYAHALELFHNELLQDAHFIFIAADLKTCLERVDNRTLHPTSKDDYFVPEVVLLQHYPSPYMPPSIGNERPKLIKNMDTVEELNEQLQPVLAAVLGQEEQLKHVAEVVGSR